MYLDIVVVYPNLENLVDQVAIANDCVAIDVAYDEDLKRH
jgi:hypothetical protein